MGKRLINLYAEDDIIEMAKLKGINLSLLFRKILSAEIDIEKEEDAQSTEQLINKLKARNGLLSSEVEQVRKEIQKLEKENLKLKGKLSEEEDKNVGRTIDLTHSDD